MSVETLIRLRAVEEVDGLEEGDGFVVLYTEQVAVNFDGKYDQVRVEAVGLVVDDGPNACCANSCFPEDSRTCFQGPE